ncbi:MAG: hypothetical protein ACPW60_12290 [Methylohalobius sp. ZOD2]
MPDEKAHPNCMCMLIPQVTPRQEKGNRNPGELLARVDAQTRKRMAPKWARELNALGVDWDRMLDPESRWFTTKKALAARVGKDSIGTMQALGRSLETPTWPASKFGLRGGMWRKTRRSLARHIDEPEVRRLVEQVENGGAVDSRTLHYIKRKWLDGWPLRSPRDLDRYYAETLSASDAVVFQKSEGTRYHVYSGELGRTAVVQPDGRRITVMPDDLDRLTAELGEPKWNVQALIATIST